MALSPFLAFVLPLCIIAIFVYFFYKIITQKTSSKIRKRIENAFVALFFPFLILYVCIMSVVPEVWIISDYVSCSHKYVLLPIGKYSNYHAGRYYVVNETNNEYVYAVFHYGVGLSDYGDKAIVIQPYSSMCVAYEVESAFKEPPETIRVRRGETTMRAYILKIDQLQ